MSFFPDTVNGDVFRRLEQSGFKFGTEHPVEYLAVYASEEETDTVALQFVNDWNDGENFKKIETKPHEEGGMELTIVIIMKVSYENVTSFEARLKERTSAVDGYLDGWGVWQE